MKKGIIVFYINHFPEDGQNVDDIINMVRQQNKDLIDTLIADGNYKVMFVPTVREASRVEKIDFDQPHPRFINGNILERDEE